MVHPFLDVAAVGIVMMIALTEALLRSIYHELLA